MIFSENRYVVFRIVFKRRNGALKCAPQAEFSGVWRNALPQNSALGDIRRPFRGHVPRSLFRPYYRDIKPTMSRLSWFL
jgi:hypothetical protein